MMSSQPNPFGGSIPGFEFLNHLTQNATGGAAGQGGAVPGMPPMNHWVTPTLDVEEIDKRIQDLKAVHFWLEQNTKGLAATIQALEVQRMTLSALQGMNVSMQEMAAAFQPQPAEEPATEAPRSTVDPALWWGALTEQFQAIAASAVRDMGAATDSPTPRATTPQKRATSKAPAKAKAAAKKPRVRPLGK